MLVVGFLEVWDRRVAMAAASSFLHPPVNVVRDSFLDFGLRYFTLSIYSFISFY